MNELQHHGVKGMKWGVRRYQKKDGSLTPAGRKRYSDVDVAKADMKNAKRAYDKSFNKAYNRAAAAYSPFKKHREANDARWKDAADKAEQYRNAKAKYKQAKKDEKAKFKKEADAEWVEIEKYRQERKAKKAAEKALKKAEKQEYKDYVKTRSKEILAGESAVGKIWDSLTGSHKYQAQIEYDLNKRHPNLD